MNAGYKEAMKQDNYTCLIMHDVDMIPENDRNIYSCPDNHMRHLAANLNRNNYT